MNRVELIRIVQRIMDDDGTSREIDELVGKLQQSVPDPNVTNYIFWSDTPMTAEEVVDKALTYVVQPLPATWPDLSAPTPSHDAST
jgi:hypothetical protein